MTINRFGVLACALPRGEGHLWYLSRIRNEMTTPGLAWQER